MVEVVELRGHHIDSFKDFYMYSFLDNDLGYDEQHTKLIKEFYLNILNNAVRIIIIDRKDKICEKCPIKVDNNLCKIYERIYNEDEISKTDHNIAKKYNLDFNREYEKNEFLCRIGLDLNTSSN